MAIYPRRLLSSDTTPLLLFKLSFINMTRSRGKVWPITNQFLRRPMNKCFFWHLRITSGEKTRMSKRNEIEWCFDVGFYHACYKGWSENNRTDIINYIEIFSVTYCLSKYSPCTYIILYSLIKHVKIHTRPGVCGQFVNKRMAPASYIFSFVLAFGCTVETGTMYRYMDVRVSIFLYWYIAYTIWYFLYRWQKASIIRQKQKGAHATYGPLAAHLCPTAPVFVICI
jgi:hypothetical protein